MGCFFPVPEKYLQTISEEKAKQFKARNPNKEPRISDLAIMISDVHPKYRSQVSQKLIDLTRRT